MKNVLLTAFLLSGLGVFAEQQPGIKFIENKNQWPDKVHFLGSVPGGHMAIQAGVFDYYFLDGRRIQELHERTYHPDAFAGDQWHGETKINGQTIRATFIGANTSSVPVASHRSPEYYNYFIGRDPGRWGTKAYAYGNIVYPSFYEGIDLKIYSVDEHVKYDLVVAPERDPRQIRIEYQGADALYLDNGNLYVKTALADIIEKRPYAYQIIGGRKREVACEFNLDRGLISFCFPEGYDPCYELVIDPLLIFSTYSGSEADNWGSTATPGEKGNLYSAGVTNHYIQVAFGLDQYSGEFPATPGAFQTEYGGLFDVGILKYDSLGKQLLYASYLGGNDSESPHSMVVNQQDELIILGTTSSPDFPVSDGAYDNSFNGGTFVSHVVDYTNGSDIFIARINKDGTQLLASTYLGGSLNDGLNPGPGELRRNYGDQLRGDVITDDIGNIYISSVTASTNFPAKRSVDTTYNQGGTDAIVMKLPADLGTITWSTFLGGSGHDAAHTLKLDGVGNIFVAGGTTSPNFPVSTTAYQKAYAGKADGWIAKLGNNGDVIHHATFTGTPEYDQVYFLDLNDAEEVYVYGQTAGDPPIRPAGVYNRPNSGQFVQKFNNQLTSLIFSTVFGTGKGTPDISPTAFLVNECNNLYLSGWGGVLENNAHVWPTSTVNLEVTPDALQGVTTGYDFYFIVLTDDASQLLYATYLGGTQSRTHVDGGTSRFDKGGVVYHAVCSGCRAENTTGGNSSDFPTTPGAWSRTNNSLSCNNAAFKFDLSSLKARLQTNSIQLDMPGLNKVCLPDPIVVQNFSIGGEIFEWDLGDGTRITKLDTSAIVHEYKSTGKYKIGLKAIDRGTCKVKDSTFTFVEVFDADATIQDDDALCEASVYQLKASGGAQYHWTSEDKSFESREASPAVSPSDTTRYFITITEFSGCVHRDTVQLNVIPLIEPEFEIVRDADCFSTPSVYVKNITDSLREGDRMFFDFGDGTTADVEEVNHQFEKDGQYAIRLVGVREFCVTEKAVSLPFFTLKVPNVITPGNPDDANDTFTIQFSEQQGVTPADYGYKVSLIVYNRWGVKVFEADDYQYNWSGEDLAAGVYFFEATIQDHTTCKSWVHLVK